MLQRNTDAKNGFVNGTIGVVTEIKNGFHMKPDKIIFYFATNYYQTESVCGKFEIFFWSIHIICKTTPYNDCLWYNDS